MNKTQTDKSHEFLPPHISDAIYILSGTQDEITQVFRKEKAFCGCVSLCLESGERQSSIMVKNELRARPTGFLFWLHSHRLCDWGVTEPLDRGSLISRKGWQQKQRSLRIDERLQLSTKTSHVFRTGSGTESVLDKCQLLLLFPASAIQ